MSPFFGRYSDTLLVSLNNRVAIRERTAFCSDEGIIQSTAGFPRNTCQRHSGATSGISFTDLRKDSGFNACEMRIIPKDVRDLEALTCSNVGLDQQSHNAHHRMTAGVFFPSSPLDQLWGHEIG